MSLTIETVEWQGKRYTAEVRETDRETFAMVCTSHRCHIPESHSVWFHQIVNAAEYWGDVELVK